MFDFVLGDSLAQYPRWPTPTVIISDGPYGVGGFVGDPTSVKAATRPLRASHRRLEPIREVIHGAGGSGTPNWAGRRCIRSSNAMAGSITAVMFGTRALVTSPEIITHDEPTSEVIEEMLGLKFDVVVRDELMSSYFNSPHVHAMSRLPGLLQNIVRKAAA